MIDKSKFNDKKELRTFGIGLAVILAVIGTIQYFVGRDLFPYFYVASGVSLLLSLTVPILIMPFFIFMQYFGMVMNFIMTRVILAILFYVVFTAIGGTARLLGKNFLKMKIYPEKKTYWLDKNQEESQRYENQF